MSIDPDLMDIAVSIEKDIPSRITGENRVFIRAVIARELTKARSQAYEECAKIVEARVELFTSYGSGITGRNALKEAANSIRSQAIRQHSQKGEDK